MAKKVNKKAEKKQSGCTAEKEIHAEIKIVGSMNILDVSIKFSDLMDIVTEVGEIRNFTLRYSGGNDEIVSAELIDMEDDVNCELNARLRFPLDSLTDLAIITDRINDLGLSATIESLKLETKWS